MFEKWPHWTWEWPALSAYFVAVLTASVALTLLLGAYDQHLLDYFSNRARGSAETFAVTCCFLAMLYAGLPYWLGVVIAKRFNIRHILYYVSGGAITGAISLPFFALFFFPINLLENERDIRENAALVPILDTGEIASLLAVSGAAAGFVCWLSGFRRVGKAKEQLGKSESSRPVGD